MKPRFPILPWILFQFLAAALCLAFPWAVENAIRLWPAGIVIALLVAAISAFAYAVQASALYFDALSLWQHEQRRINPMAFHIHD